MTGARPLIDLFLHDPIGSKTGKLLPTGKPSELIDGRNVSCVDVAVPIVIAAAAEFGKTGYERSAELAADNNSFKTALRATWAEAGLRMNLKRRDGTLMSADDLTHSETIPRICIVAPARGAGISPSLFHASNGARINGWFRGALSGGGVPVAGNCPETTIGSENPAGILETTAVAATADASIASTRVAYNHDEVGRSLRQARFNRNRH